MRKWCKCSYKKDEARIAGRYCTGLQVQVEDKALCTQHFARSNSLRPANVLRARKTVRGVQLYVPCPKLFFMPFSHRVGPHRFLITAPSNPSMQRPEPTPVPRWPPRPPSTASTLLIPSSSFQIGGGIAVSDRGPAAGQADQAGDDAMTGLVDGDFEPQPLRGIREWRTHRLGRAIFCEHRRAR